MIESTKRRTLVRRSRIPVLALALASLVVPFVSASPASASSTTCTKPAGAFASFHAAFSNGTMALGSATATGLSATACGAVTGTLGSLVSTVQPGDIEFPAVSVKLLFLSLPATITVNAPLSGPFRVYGAGFSKADVNLTANLSASASLLGFKCVIGPLTPTLTTGASGSLQGTTFTGSLTSGYVGKVVANDFAVPAIQRSRSCPWLIATLANVLVGLPAAAGKASISMEGSITVP